MRFASADRRSLWLWCGLGVFAWLMLASILGASQASAAERPDAAPGASASAAAQQRASHSDEGRATPAERPARTAGPAAATKQVTPRAEKAAAPMQKTPAPVKKATASIEKAAAPVKKATASIEKAAAPVKKATASIEKAAAPVKKATASAKNTAAASSALGSALAAVSDNARGDDKAMQSSHALAMQKSDVGVSPASPQAAAAGARQGQEEDAAHTSRGHAGARAVTGHAERAVTVGTHHSSKPFKAPHTSAAAPATASTAAPVIAAESAPVEGPVPGPASSTAASSGCAAASGASSILSLAGEVTGLASRHGLIRLNSFANAADRPLAGPAAATDCRPD